MQENPVRIGAEWTHTGKRERAVNITGSMVLVARWIAKGRIVRRLETVAKVQQYINQDEESR